MTAILDFESEPTMATTPADAFATLMAQLTPEQRLMVQAMQATAALVVPDTLSEYGPAIHPTPATRGSRGSTPRSSDSGLRDASHAVRAAKYGTTAMRAANVALYRARGVWFRDTDTFRVIGANPKRNPSAGYQRFEFCRSLSGRTVASVAASFEARGWAIYFAEEIRYNMLDGLYTVEPAGE